MIYDKDKELLKRYRHLIAALIAYSIGYFTPLAALQAIKDYKNNEPNFCEWFLDIAWKRGTNTDEDFLTINRNIIRASGNKPRERHRTRSRSPQSEYRDAACRDNRSYRRGNKGLLR